MSIFVDDIREHYRVELLRDGLKPEVLKLQKPFLRRRAFVKPCQIDVFEFSSVSKTLWIVKNKENKPDKKFEIVEGIRERPMDFMSTDKKYEEYRFAFDFSELEKEDLGDFFHRVGANILAAKGYTAMLFFSNPRDTSPMDLALTNFQRYRTYVFRSIQTSRIEDSTSKILTEARKLKKTEISPLILNEIKSIRDSLGKMKKIDVHEQKLTSIEDEIVGVRKLVGTRGFGEWKVLVTEIDKLNIRIDALSDIKDAYDKVLAQQAEVIKQQSSFMNWIKYSTILLPIAVASIAIIEILIRYLLGVL